MRSSRFFTFVIALPLALLSACDRGAHPAQLSTPAPDFTVSDGSTSVHLADYRGKVVLLNFWATWCAPCIQETLAKLFRTEMWPETYVIDRKGVIRRKFVGAEDWSDPEVRSFLKSL